LRNLGLTVEAAAGAVEAAEASCRAAAESVAAEQVQYTEARRERRVVERLRENRKARWAEDLVREEQQEHDGLARHRRSTGGSGR
jgi:flagellar biosynthesis chaperone FliJ